MCYAHTNPSGWRAAGDRGRQNRVESSESCPPIKDAHDLTTPAGTLALLAECLELTRAGLLPTKVGHTIAALANSARAYHELTDLEQRISALEEANTTHELPK
jgi:hypothetical protein